jgi:hypothetical protein
MLNTNVIGLVLTFAGIGEVVGGVLFGRLGDALGRSASIFVGSVCYGTGLALACYMRASGWMPAPVVAQAPLVAFFAAFLFGLGDSSFNANCYAICAQIYHDGPEDGGDDADEEGGDGEHGRPLLKGGGDGEAGARGQQHGGGGGAGQSVEGDTNSVGAFTIFQLVQNIGSCVGFFYALPLPMHDPGSNAVAGGPTVGSYTQAYVQFAVMAVATLGFIAVDRLHAAEAAAKKEERQGRGRGGN